MYYQTEDLLISVPVLDKTSRSLAVTVWWNAKLLLENSEHLEIDKQRMPEDMKISRTAHYS